MGCSARVIPTQRQTSVAPDPAGGPLSMLPEESVAKSIRATTDNHSIEKCRNAALSASISTLLLEGVVPQTSVSRPDMGAMSAEA